MDWLTTAQALERLGVRAQTLYAYVSRGRVGVRPDPADSRKSLYRADDIDGLRRRRARGRKPALVAQDAIAWGEPVLASAISTVIDGRLYYRGRDVVELARDESLEGIARRLRGLDPGARAVRRMTQPPSLADAKARAFAFLSGRAALDAPAAGRAPAGLASEADGLLNGFCDAVAGALLEGPIHHRLASAWGRPEHADLVRRALVLLADHELNASAFAARVAASTGASQAAAALAGLATLSGPLHGAMHARVRALALEAERLGAEAALRACLDQGLRPPGFGHPLYPDGDPRAKALLSAFEPSPLMQSLRAAGEEQTGKGADVDFALTAMALTLELPADAPFLLFAVARCAGWLAHAEEQRESGALIRPRARYVGSAPA